MFPDSFQSHPSFVSFQVNAPLTTLHPALVFFLLLMGSKTGQDALFLIKITKLKLFKLIV